MHTLFVNSLSKYEIFEVIHTVTFYFLTSGLPGLPDFCFLATFSNNF